MKRRRRNDEQGHCAPETGNPEHGLWLRRVGAPHLIAGPEKEQEKIEGQKEKCVHLSKKKSRLG